MLAAMSGNPVASEEAMRQRNLMAMGAALAMSGGQGEAFGTGAGRAALAGMSATDSMMQAALKSQMQERAMKAEESKVDMLKKREKLYQDAADNYKSSLPDGELTTPKDHMYYASIAGGHPAEVLAAELRNPFSSLMNGSGSGGAGGAGGTGGSGGGGKDDGWFNFGSNDNVDHSLFGFLSSPFNPVHGFGTEVGKQWDDNILSQTGKNIANNPAFQGTMDQVPGVLEDYKKMGKRGLEIMGGTLKEAPGVIGDYWDSAKGMWGSLKDNVIDPVSSGVGNLVDSVQSSTAETRKRQYPYADQLPKFSKPDNLSLSAARGVYNTVMQGGKEAGQELLASGNLNKEQRQYLIDLLTWKGE